MRQLIPLLALFFIAAAGCQQQQLSVQDQHIQALEKRVTALEQRLGEIQKAATSATHVEASAITRTPIPNPSPSTDIERNGTSINYSAELAKIEAREFAAANSYMDADSQIRTMCAAKWNADFQMRAYCEKQQHKAVAKLEEGNPSDVPIDTFMKIRTQCAGKWSDDYVMRNYCENQQFDGFRKVN